MMALAGCAPHFNGEYEGEAVLTAVSPTTVVLFDTGTKKGPVHVTVGPASFEIEGAPFARCTPKVAEVSRRGMMLDFSGGACQVLVKGQSIPFGDGAGIATLEGDKLELFFNGKVGSDGLALTATRKK